jgi:hypothetical protein
MRAPSKCLKSLAAVLVVAAGAASAETGGAATPLMYRLIGDPQAEQSLLATRWAPPTLSLRLDAAAGLGAHELRILSAGMAARLPPLSAFGRSDAMVGWNIEPVRATYRYTLLADASWEMKLGLSANVRERLDRPGALSASETSFGSLPLLHVAGVGHWSPRWRLAFALDGLATGRGRALDLGLQVDYLWSPSMSLYGGYQVTEAAGESEAYYGSGLTNRANIGLRYRF